jgi:hypothetical protein
LCSWIDSHLFCCLSQKKHIKRGEENKKNFFVVAKKEMSHLTALFEDVPVVDARDTLISSAHSTPISTSVGSSTKSAYGSRQAPSTTAADGYVSDSGKSDVSDNSVKLTSKPASKRPQIPIDRLFRSPNSQGSSRRQFQSPGSNSARGYGRADSDIGEDSDNEGFAKPSASNKPRAVFDPKFDYKILLPQWKLQTGNDFGYAGFIRAGSATYFILTPRIEGSKQSAICIKYAAIYFGFIKERGLPQMVCNANGGFDHGQALDNLDKYNITVNYWHFLYSQAYGDKLDYLNNELNDMVRQRFYQFHREYLHDYWVYQNNHTNQNGQFIAGDDDMEDDSIEDEADIADKIKKAKISRPRYEDYQSSDGESLYGDSSECRLSGDESTKDMYAEENEESSYLRPMCPVCHKRKCTWKSTDSSCNHFYSCSECFNPMETDDPMASINSLDTRTCPVCLKQFSSDKYAIAREITE